MCALCSNTATPPPSSLDRNPRDLPRAQAPCLQQTEALTDRDGNRKQSLWYHKARFVTTTLFLVAFGQNAGFGLAGSHRWYLGTLDHSFLFSFLDSR